MYKLALMFVSLLFLVGAPAGAAAKSGDNWLVTQLSGDARVVHPGLQAVSLKVNGELTAGDTLLTGPTGRATLVRGGDYIVVAPHSELRVPSAQQPSGFTRVIQNLGTMLFKVQHTGIPHFAVDTPMLAAVVKGTTFTVVVDQRRSAVQVIQGVVQVSAIDGGMSRMVEGGKTVFVNHINPKVLLDADRPAPASSAPSSAGVEVSAAADPPLAVISALTGGMVRADFTSSPAPAATTMAVVQAATSLVPAPSARAPTTSTVAPVTVLPNGTLTITTAPIATSPTATVQSPATPGVTISSTTVTLAAVPSVSTPSVTVPVVTVPSTSTPSVTVAAITVPSTSTPSVTIPAATVPSISTTSVTAPSTTAPTVSIPSVTTPTVTVPSISTPSISLPVASVPSVTTPTITVPSISLPGLKI